MLLEFITDITGHVLFSLDINCYEDNAVLRIAMDNAVWGFKQGTIDCNTPRSILALADIESDTGQSDPIRARASAAYRDCKQD
jgi:hypothetical protein